MQRSELMQTSIDDITISGADVTKRHTIVYEKTLHHALHTQGIRTVQEMLQATTFSGTLWEEIDEVASLLSDALSAVVQNEEIIESIQLRLHPGLSSTAIDIIATLLADKDIHIPSLLGGSMHTNIQKTSWRSVDDGRDGLFSSRGI